MAATILARDEIDRAKYRSAIVRLIHFAITKLNEKAVYANTLVLSGRILGESGRHGTCNSNGADAIPNQLSRSSESKEWGSSYYDRFLRSSDHS